jgi:S-DNA-T family DNA segregation ATPase FtsK/SpoIIIE
MILFTDIMDSVDTEGALPVAIGVDDGNIDLVIDLAETPHLLIAGATGSGKSVMVNTIICSLLSWAHPEEVQLVLMDFKRVELAPYRDVPHLLLPVITEYDEARLALAWLNGEMDARFRILEQLEMRNIAEYRHDDRDDMPYIVVVIDEMADLMLGMPDIEPFLVRLAQKARAVGIHLILATQRPSIDVVTGLIKANVPARMAFAVASSTDSRVVLDQPGAEDLAGKGQFLYRDPRHRSLIKAQGAYIDMDTIRDLVNNIKEEPHGLDSIPAADQPATQEGEAAHD